MNNYIILTPAPIRLMNLAASLWPSTSPPVRPSTLPVTTTTVSTTTTTTEEVSTDNSTDTFLSEAFDWDSPYPIAFQVFLWAFVIVISLETILGNLLVLLSYYTDHTLRQPSNFFIASLAISDLIIGLEGFPVLTIYVINGEKWSLGRFSCKLWLSLDYTLCLVSILTVLLITVDRYCSVCHAASYRRWQSMEKVQISIVLSWLIPAVLFFPTIFGLEDNPDATTCYAPFLNDPYLNMSLYITYYWTTLVLMIVLYHGIHKTARVLEERGKAKERQQVAMAALQQCMAKMGVGMMISAHQRAQQAMAIINEEERPLSMTKINRRQQRRSRVADDSGYTSTGGTNTKSQNLQSDDHDPNPALANVPEQPHESVAQMRSLGIVSSITSDSLKSYCTTYSNQSYTDCSFTTAVELLVADASATSSSNNSNILNRSPAGRLKMKFAKQISMQLSDRVDSFSITSQVSARDDEMALIADEGASNKGSIRSQTAVVHRSNSKYSNRSLSVRRQTSFENSSDLMSPNNGRSPDSFVTAYTELPGSKANSVRSSPRLPPKATSPKPTNCMAPSESIAFVDQPLPASADRRYSVQQRTGCQPTGMLAPRATLTEMSLIPRSATIEDMFPRRHTIESLKAAMAAPTQVPVTTALLTLPGAEIELAPNGTAARGSIKPRRGTKCSTSSTFATEEDETPSSGDEQDKEERKASAGTTATGFRRTRTLLRQKSSRFAPSFSAEGGRLAMLLNTAWLNRKRKQTKAEKRARKAFRTISIILGSFVLLWSPYYILATVYGFCADCVPSALFILSYYMCYINSSLNPFCYALANRQYKTAFTRILNGDLERR